MTDLIIDVADQETVNARMLAAFDGKPQGEYVSFPTIERFHKVMTPRRFAIIERLQQIGPIGLRGLARDMNIDPGNLQRDLKPLREFGIVEDAGEGLMVPYDRVRVEIVMGKVA